MVSIQNLIKLFENKIHLKLDGFSCVREKDCDDNTESCGWKYYFHFDNKSICVTFGFFDDTPNKVSLSIISQDNLHNLYAELDYVNDEKLIEKTVDYFNNPINIIELDIKIVSPFLVYKDEEIKNIINKFFKQKAINFQYLND